MKFLYEIDDLYIATIISRPSKTCKSPYVADIYVPDLDDYAMAHAPSLGCGGLCNKGSTVYVTLHPNPSTCQYIIHYSKQINENNETQYEIIGTHPKSAEQIVHSCLYNDVIQSLSNVYEIRSEVSIKEHDSRFDFVVTDKNNTETIIEVKNVPLADYEDIYAKDRKKRNYDDREWNSKVSYFPDGYRKKQTDTVSPRALKHITELMKIKEKRRDNVRCVMVYVIQRTDSEVFQPSIIDPIYRDAFINAYKSGVEMIAIQIKWTENGECYFVKELPINID